MTRPHRAVLVGLLVALAAASCGGSSTNETTKPGTAAGASGAGSPATDGKAGAAGSSHAGSGSGHGGGAGAPLSSTGGSGANGGSGATSSAGKGGTAPLAGRGGGAGSFGGLSSGAGKGGSSAGGSNAGRSSGGGSGESTGGDGGSAGERAIECMGTMPYFPEFDRACTTDADCVAVAHQTSCCGAELVLGIRSTELAAFNAAETTCKEQYPACGCASQGVDVEDGTLIGYEWQSQVVATCDAGSCKAHYSGTSFSCGTRRCTETQYCVQSSGGPAGTPTSYACTPTGCSDCSCITMASCTCGQAGGHLTLTCEYP